MPPPPSLDNLGPLPPPPPLNIVLNGNDYKPASLPSLPPPPSLANLNLPPPPSLANLNLPPPPALTNLNLPPVSNLPGVLPPPPPLSAPLSIPSPSSNPSEAEEHHELPIAPVSEKPKQLSMQDELALRLKHGKNYKK